MCPREDETYRSTRYGGHPPACTCVACCEKRRSGISTGHKQKSASGIPVWFWVIIGVVITAVLLALLLN